MSPDCVQEGFQLEHRRYPTVGAVYDRALFSEIHEICAVIDRAYREEGNSTCRPQAMAVTQGIRRSFSEGGVKVVLTRSLKRLVRPAFKIGTLVFTEADLTKPFPELRSVPGIVMREATIEDVRLFADRKLFLKRFNDGDRCFMGIEEGTGKLANYRWINTSAAFIPELDRYLVLRPGEAYAYDLNTLPEFRRRGIDAFTRHHAYGYMRDIGYKKMLAYIHGDNQPSLQASRHFLKPIGCIRFIQFPGRQPIMIGGRGPGFPQLRRM